MRVVTQKTTVRVRVRILSCACKRSLMAALTSARGKSSQVIVPTLISPHMDDTEQRKHWLTVTDPFSRLWEGQMQSKFFKANFLKQQIILINIKHHKWDCSYPEQHAQLTEPWSALSWATENEMCLFSFKCLTLFPQCEKSKPLHLYEYILDFRLLSFFDLWPVNPSWLSSFLGCCWLARLSMNKLNL